MFLAEDVMTRTVVTVSTSASLKTLSVKMANRRISSIVVVTGKKPVGIISERDFVKKILSKGRSQQITAKDIMTTPVISLRPRDTISHAVKVMKEQDIRHLLVSEDGNIKGIISETDLLRGETNYVKAHQLLQNLIMALFLTLLLLFIVVFRVKP